MPHHMCMDQRLRMQSAVRRPLPGQRVMGCKQHPGDAVLQHAAVKVVHPSHATFPSCCPPAFSSRSTGLPVGRSIVCSCHVWWWPLWAARWVAAVVMAFLAMRGIAMAMTVALSTADTTCAGACQERCSWSFQQNIKL